VALWFLRHHKVKATPLPLGSLVLPGTLGMFVAFGMMLMVQYLPADREDGTLLRARATPNGIGGYLTAKLVTSSLSVLVYLAMIGIPGAFIAGGLRPDEISWATLAWVLVLGMIGTQLLGATLGALVPSQRSVGYVSMPLLGLVGISGIFYPITGLPGWLEDIAQVFPVYWLGLGMRAAFLPPGAASVEIGQSWRSAETAAVLGVWALVGLIVAPLVLRRMARRESGARMPERRERTRRAMG
jgi:ABC-2 type transport system permease protein